jgi:uncharacterized membrane protein YiaA
MIIIIFKIVFITLAVIEMYVKHKEPNNIKRINSLDFWKKRIEFIFIILMSLLLIYLFNPRVNRLNMIDNNTKILLYLFGFILFYTADWGHFFQDSKIKLFKNVLGDQ